MGNILGLSLQPCQSPEQDSPSALHTLPSLLYPGDDWALALLVTAAARGPLTLQRLSDATKAWPWCIA